MAVEYVQVKPGVLRKGDTVFEVVRFNGDMLKYNQGKVVQLLGDKVAQVKLVSNGKTAKIPFKDLAIGAGLYEARTNAESSRASRLEAFKEKNATVTGVHTIVPPAVAEPVAAPVTEPVAAPVTEPVAAPVDVPVPAPVKTEMSTQDEFAAWLSIGVDFLPVLEKRIAEREIEIAKVGTTMAAITAAHEARMEALKTELAAEREALGRSFEEKEAQLTGWKHIHSLLSPLTASK